MRTKVVHWKMNAILQPRLCAILCSIVNGFIPGSLEEIAGSELTVPHNPIISHLSFISLVSSFHLRGMPYLPLFLLPLCNLQSFSPSLSSIPFFSPCSLYLLGLMCILDPTFLFNKYRGIEGGREKRRGGKEAGRRKEAVSYRGRRKGEEGREGGQMK